MALFIPINLITGTFNCFNFPFKTKFSFNISKTYIIFFLFVTVGAIKVYGVTKTATVSGDWSSTTTWGGASVPLSTDDVIIYTGINVTVCSNAACASVQLGVANSGTGISTLILASGSQVTISGNFIIGDNNGNSSHLRYGSLDMTNGGILKIGGTIYGYYLIPSDWKPGTGTIEYNGSSNQTLFANTYNNLTLSGSGVKTITGITVNGILSLEGIATTNGTVPTYGSNATLQYKGNASQTTNAELPAVFNGAGGLILNNSAGVTIGTNAIVNGTTQITPVTSKLIIPPGKCLTTTTITTKNDPGQIYIQASPTGVGGNGSLIFQNSGAVYGTVEMYSLAACTFPLTNSGYKWQFFGIPLHNLETASPTLDGGYVRKLNENESPAHWEQLNNASSLTPFTGYEITQLNPKTYVFQGQLENGNHTVNLSNTTGKPFAGQNLIGNPYTAAIDISKLTFGGNILSTVYIYNTGSYYDWQLAGSGNSSDSTKTISNFGQYNAIPYALAGIAGLQHQIPSMQAFLVKALDNTATLTIPYSSVGTMVGNNVPQRAKGLSTDSTSEKICTIIDVKGSRFSDRMWIFTEPGCTHSFDNAWDGEKYLGSYLTPQIYAIEPDGDYQVNSVDDMNNTSLGFKTGEDSIYTFYFTHKNLGSQYGNVYLVDSIGQQTVDITANGSTYSFISLPTDTIIKRFKIVTTPEATTNVSIPVTSGKQLKIFSSQRAIFVDNSTDSEGELSVYDISGRFIHKYKFTSHGVTALNTRLAHGNYLVKGITRDATVTKNISL